MRSWTTFTILFLFFGIGLVAATPIKERKTKPKKEVGPVEIDFSPLAGVRDKDYTITVMFEIEDGTHFKESYSIQNGTSPTSVRDLVIRSIPEGPWKVKSLGDAKLLINGSISKIEIKAVGIPKATEPTTRRTKK